MDRVEFTMEPNLRDFRYATFRRLFISRVFRIYLCLIIGGLLIRTVLANLCEASKHADYNMHLIDFFLWVTGL